MNDHITSPQLTSVVVRWFVGPVTWGHTESMVVEETVEVFFINTRSILSTPSFCKYSSYKVRNHNYKCELYLCKCANFFFWPLAFLG